MMMTRLKMRMPSYLMFPVVKYYQNSKIRFYIKKKYLEDDHEHLKPNVQNDLPAVGTYIAPGDVVVGA